MLVAVVGLSPGQAAASGRNDGGGKIVDGVVNLNTAPPALLLLLPGVGPGRVRGIVAYRARRPFRTVDELVRVKGIGRRMVREIRPHLAVTGPTTARAGPGILEAPPAIPPPPTPPAPSVRPLCRPNAVPIRPGRKPSDRTVRSAADHCAPPA
jgi:hypothetical protein